MDRSIFWPGSLPRSLDMNMVGRQSMVALGELMLDVFGSGTFCTGLPCAPTAPLSLAVQVGGGRIYSLQNLEATPISTGLGLLAADTAHQILKQGINLSASTISCAAPVTSGQSINYLIEAQYADQDTNLIVLPYYNSTPPNVPLSGPANSGGANATTRAGIVSLQAKAGISAATGTQTTPSVDAGWVGLYVVTVAQGATTITSGNISLLATAPILTAGSVFTPFPTGGNWTPTYTGFSAAPTGPITWALVGPMVAIQLPSSFGTSNVNTYSITNVPTALRPINPQYVPISGLTDNTVSASGPTEVLISGATMTFALNGSSSGWTPSGSKGSQGSVFFYSTNVL